MPKLKKTPVFLASAAVALVSPLLLTTTAQAAPKASATVVSLPTTVRPFESTEYVQSLGAVDLKVKYRCRNDATTTYYILASVTQGETSYTRGARNSPGSFFFPNCTGKTVKDVVRVYSYPSSPRLEKGIGVVSLTLASRAPGTPGYYGVAGTGPSVTKSQRVKIATPLG